MTDISELLPKAEGDNGEVLLYLDDGTTRPYSLHSISFRLEAATGVGVVAHNTESNLHALTQNQQMEYFIILEHAKRCPDVKVLLWTAAGERAFGSGADFRGGFDVKLDMDVRQQYWKRGMSPLYDAKDMSRLPRRDPDIALKRQTLAFWDFPKPIVGAINGLAVGGHANVALANYFDVVLCSTKARFKYPFAALGITPELGSSLLFPQTIGMARAKHVMLAGDWFGARWAKDVGLVTDVFEPDDLFPKALAYARKLAASKPSALTLGKKILNAHVRQNLESALDLENETIREAVKALGGTMLGGGGASKKASKRKARL